MKIKQPLYLNIDYQYGKTTQNDQEKESAYGRITIDDFKEYFYMSPQAWTMEQYQEQWKLALERIKSHDTSCFVTNYQLSNKMIIMWVMNKNKKQKRIYFYNVIIVEEYYDQLIQDQKVTPQNSFEFIPCCKKGKDYFGNIVEPTKPTTKLEKLLDSMPPQEWYVDYED